MNRRPPFDITVKVLNLIEAIGKELGALEVTGLQRSDIRLRRENQVKTIQSSLAIEGNTLSLEEVRKISNGQIIDGVARDIKEVNNAIEIYSDLRIWDPLSKKSLLEAHRILMQGLIHENGQWRKGSVGIFKESIIAHIAPPASKVDELMENLFQFIRNERISWLIKACVFHYEIEFIHPFSDGNGRMGRLWQQLLLMNDSLIFQYVPVEEIIRRYQKEYYIVLGDCDKKGDSTRFIEFSLDKILIALREMPRKERHRMKSKERIQEGLILFGKKWFTRKDYAQEFDISSATASRDLCEGVKTQQLVKEGDKAASKYRYKS